MWRVMIWRWIFIYRITLWTSTRDDVHDLQGRGEGNEGERGRGQGDEREK